MDHNKILQTVLAKAVANGFVIKPHHFMSRDKETGEMYGYESIVFDPDFAKALWPGFLDPINGQIHKTRPHGYPTYNHAEYHLERMVLSPDRLAYLEANT